MPGVERDPPSAFFLDALPKVRLAHPEGPVLDLACGRGRHAVIAARAGLPTVPLDRNAAFIRALQTEARTESLPLYGLRADLEQAPELPLAPGSFGVVVVFRYLWRPLCPKIAELVKPGGWLVYETFTTHQRTWNRGPRNPDFLLEPGEIPKLFPGFRVERFEETTGSAASPTALASLLAQKPG